MSEAIHSVQWLKDVYADTQMQIYIISMGNGKTHALVVALG